MTVSSDQLEVMSHKIRRLLEQAEATTFPAEAQAATRKAEALMAKYRIDFAMVEASKPATRDEVASRSISVGRGPYVNARYNLLDGIAKAFDCKCVYYTRWDGREAILVGFESDMAAVEMLYTSLLLQSANAVKAEQVPSGSKSVHWRRSFLLGFASEVTARLRADKRAARAAAEAAEQAAVQTACGSDGDGLADAGSADVTSTPADGPADSGSPSVALVLAARSRRVEDEYKRQFPKVGTARRSAPAGYAAVQLGRAAGAKANLSTSAGVAASRPTASLGR